VLTIAIGTNYFWFANGFLRAAIIFGHQLSLLFLRFKRDVCESTQDIYANYVILIMKVVEVRKLLQYGSAGGKDPLFFNETFTAAIAQ
jgi:hypothetical protein